MCLGLLSLFFEDFTGKRPEFVLIYIYLFYYFLSIRNLSPFFSRSTPGEANPIASIVADESHFAIGRGDVGKRASRKCDLSRFLFSSIHFFFNYIGSFPTSHLFFFKKKKKKKRLECISLGSWRLSYHKLGPAIQLDRDLKFGCSYATATFGNPPLAGIDGVFTCNSFELWVFKPMQWTFLVYSRLLCI